MIGLSFLSNVIDTFRRRGCLSLAASLAFFSLLSLFPMVFLLLYGISFIVSQDVIGYQFLLGFLKGFLPSMGERLAKDIRRVAEQEEVRWAVFLAFGWFSALVFYELDYAMNTVFGTAAKRHPLISTLVAVAMIWMLGFLALSRSLPHRPSNCSLPMRRACGDLISSRSPRTMFCSPIHYRSSSPLPPSLVSIDTFRTSGPHGREATIGGVVFSLLWVSAKVVFVTYLEDAAVYTQMYGSLLEVVLLLLWVYYSSALVLLGAVVTHNASAGIHPRQLCVRSSSPVGGGSPPTIFVSFAAFSSALVRA